MIDEVVAYVDKNAAAIIQALWQHIEISLIAILITIVIAIPLAIGLVNRRNHFPNCRRDSDDPQPCSFRNFNPVCWDWHGTGNYCLGAVRNYANLPKYLCRPDPH